MGIFEKKESDVKKTVEEQLFSIDRETAEDEFNRICLGWEIFLDFDSYNEEEKVDVKKLKSQIINSIRLGRLSYKSDETISYVISEKSKDHAGKELIISRPIGKAYLGTDNFKEKDGMHKTYAVLGEMTKKPIQFITSLDGIDLKALQAVQNLFFAS